MKSFAQKNPPIYQGDATHKLKVDVLAEKTPEFMTALNAPEPRVVGKCIQIAEFRPSTFNPRFLSLTIYPLRAPVNLAFDVFVRIDGKEYEFGRAVFKKISGGGIGMSHHMPGGLPTRGDVILRPSAIAAEESVDLFDYWNGGEIVFKDLPVQNPGG
jgi:hypothetical protein